MRSVIAFDVPLAPTLPWRGRIGARGVPVARMRDGVPRSAPGWGDHPGSVGSSLVFALKSLRSAEESACSMLRHPTPPPSAATLPLQGRVGVRGDAYAITISLRGRRG